LTRLALQKAGIPGWKRDLRPNLNMIGVDHLFMRANADAIARSWCPETLLTFSELADTHETGWMAVAVQPVFIFVLVIACLTLSSTRSKAEPALPKSHTARNSTGGPRVQLGSVFLISLKHGQSAVHIGLKRNAMAISEQLVLYDV
jgi:hypothetical protein